jgi:serine/threonine-protein kinase
MSADNPETTEDQLASWLAACDEALAAGSVFAPTPPPPPEFTPEFQSRMQRGLACIKLLRDALPRPPSRTGDPWQTVHLPPNQRDDGPEALPARLGHYRLEEPIDRGGMGVIVRVRDEDLDRPLALKVLAACWCGTAGMPERFVREARLTGQLQHPGVPPVQELGWLPDGRPYFIMKLVQGKSLRALLRERPSPAADLPRWLAIFEQICQPLAYAHSHAIIHRDLKPANIMVGAFGEVQVMDWGLAKVLTPGQASEAALPDTGALFSLSQTDYLEDTAAGQVVGTPAYMAPEQARGEVERLDARCDVFGLGAILCEILTGEPPWSGEGPGEVLRKARLAELDEAWRRIDDCGADAALLTLARRCLDPERDLRPQSAGEVAQMLATYQAGAQDRLRAAELQRTAAQITAREERKRRKLTLALAAAVLVLLVSGGGAWWWLDRQATAEEWRQAEARRQDDLTEARVRDALGKTDQERDRLHEILKSKGGVFRLLDEPARWQNHLDAARAALDRARVLLDGAGGGVDRALEHRARALDPLLRADVADRDLALALEKVRDVAALIVKGQFNTRGAAEAYRRIFAGAGLDPLGADPRVVADRIARSLIKEQLVAALDSWSCARSRFPEGNELQRVLQVTRLAAPDPAWGDKLRHPTLSKATLEDLVRKAAINELSPSLLYFTAVLLSNARSAERLGWVRRAQAQSRRDFWLNLELGNALMESAPLEAAGFFQTAIAIRSNSSAAFNNLGRVLNELNRPAEAAAAFEEALKLAPNAPLVYNNYGIALGHMNRLEEARAAYDQALRLDPKYSLAYHNLGALFDRLEQPDRAIACYRKALRIRPNLTTYHNLIITLRGQKRWGDVVDACAEVVELDANNPRAYYELGLALADAKRFDQAIAAHRKAIGMSPKSAESYSSLGSALAGQKRFVEAVAATREAIKLDPKFVGAYQNLGNYLCKLKRTEEGIAVYRQAIAIDPRNARLYTNLGAALADLRHLDQALAEYDKALQKDPNDAQAHYNRGNALRLLGRLDEAITAYEKALACEPNHAESHCNIAVTLLAQDRPGEAIEQFQKAIAKDPNFVMAHVNLGAALCKQKRYEEARAILEKAIQMDRNSAEAYTNLASVFHSQKQTDRALATFDKAIELAPQFAPAWMGRGLTLTHKGLLREAAASTGKALELFAADDPLRPQAERQLKRTQLVLGVEEQLPLVLEGKKKASGQELADSARVCLEFLRRYPTAVQLYRQAFQSKPGGETLAGRYRFLAARAAALAGAGQGDEAAGLSADERAGMRAQARAWFRADLDHYARQLPQAQPALVLYLIEELAQRLNERDLAGLRDEKALAGLAPEEQRAWQQVWADTRRLLKDAKGCFKETRQDGALTVKETRRVHPFPLTAGKTYVIDLESTAFDPYLILETPQGQVLAENDNISRTNRNSRLLVVVREDDVYRLVVTAARRRGAGAYTLRVREFIRPVSQEPIVR